jgi:hypothetical protein
MARHFAVGLFLLAAAHLAWLGPFWGNDFFVATIVFGALGSVAALTRWSLLGFGLLCVSWWASALRFWSLGSLDGGFVATGVAVALCVALLGLVRVQRPLASLGLVAAGAIESVWLFQNVGDGIALLELGNLLFAGGAVTAGLGLRTRDDVLAARRTAMPDA